MTSGAEECPAPLGSAPTDSTPASAPRETPADCKFDGGLLTTSLLPAFTPEFEAAYCAFKCRGLASMQVQAALMWTVLVVALQSVVMAVDGAPSDCVIYYRRQDVSKIQRLVTGFGRRKRRGPKLQRDLDALDKMVAYCDQNKCRRRALVAHFGTDPGESDASRPCCDICDKRRGVPRTAAAAAPAGRPAPRGPPTAHFGRPPDPKRPRTRG